MSFTTGWGSRVDDNQNSITAGPNGPILLQDFHLLDKLAHFDRERIPERVVHAKGAGAFGYFEVTHDVSKWTKAKFLNGIGKKTPVLVRFSTVGGERGSADTARDPRGFAIKHYTEDGNYDMVGNNTPIFFIRDPILFPDFIHTQKRNPQTNLRDADAVWDFMSLVPESLHQFSFLFGDRGIPYSYRNMNGYSSHTYKWVNDKNEAVWVKLHYKTAAGIKNLSAAEAQELEGKDPDFATRDLFNHLASGKEAVWDAYVQVIPVADAEKYKWNIFDVTKVVPQKDYPLIKYGRLVLNRNPTNYFAEIEQAAFAPSNLVTGVEASPDRMLQGRLFSYADTHRHRLGPNHLQIPVNCPYAKVSNQQRDGFMTVNGNGGASPNYLPNSHPKVGDNLDVDARASLSKFQVAGVAGRYRHDHPNSDFEQVGVFWRQVLNDASREALASNIAGSLSGARPVVQQRVLDVIAKADKDYSRKVAEYLKKNSKL